MAEVSIPTADQNKPEINIPERPENYIPEVKQVAQGTLVKKSKAKSAFATFIGKDIADLKHYIFLDIVLPTIKRGLMEIVSAILGEPISRSASNRGNTTVFDYSRQYRGNTSYSRSTPQPVVNEPFRFEDVEVPIDEAQEIMNNMADLVRDRGYASLADLYQMAGIHTGRFTDNEWGWYDLSSAKIKPKFNGRALIVMPKAVSLR